MFGTPDFTPTPPRLQRCASEDSGGGRVKNIRVAATRRYGIGNYHSSSPGRDMRTPPVIEGGEP